MTASSSFEGSDRCTEGRDRWGNLGRRTRLGQPNARSADFLFKLGKNVRGYQKKKTGGNCDG
jgi:hypothetical protein